MKPTILIEEEVYKKVMHWVNKSDFEVSGLGMVRVEKDGVLRVISAMLLPQTNGAAHTDIEAEEVNRALFELRESEGELRWWWHSHVKMGVFWSGTDHDTIKKLGEGGWFACTVFNQKKEVKSCYYSKEGQTTPWGSTPLMLDDLTTKVTVPVDPREAEWDTEYEKNVTIKTPTWHARHDWGHVGKQMAPSGTTPSGTDTKAGGTAEFDPAVAPPLHKPKGMPKKTWKEWNSAHVKYTAGLKAASQPELTDDYGLTQDERTLLAVEGWDQSDIDDMLDEDFSINEIMRVAKLGVSPAEVDWLMLNGNYSHEEVMDLVDQSEGFGENLFASPQLWRAYAK